MTTIDLLKAVAHQLEIANRLKILELQQKLEVADAASLEKELSYIVEDM